MSETDKLLQLKSMIERLRTERSQVTEQLKSDTIELHKIEQQLLTHETQEVALDAAIFEKESSLAEYRKMIAESENAHREMMESTDNILKLLEKESREIQLKNARILN